MAPKGQPNPQAMGSLPQRPPVTKAMSAYQGDAGGTLVAGPKQRRYLKLKRAKQALGCMKKAILQEVAK